MTQSADTLADMRAALQACVEHAERDKLCKQITDTARQGLEHLACLERTARSARPATTTTLQLVSSNRS